MHFTAGIEIDNWVETKSGWYIGVTLKRTLRERWKQTYTTEAESGGVFREGVSPSHPQLLKRDEFYNKHKISNILWVISEDSDLSEKKITELVSYKHIVLENIGGGGATPQFFRSCKYGAIFRCLRF